MKSSPEKSVPQAISPSTFGVSFYRSEFSDERFMLDSFDRPEPKNNSDDLITQEIASALKGLEFGEVKITVREGQVIQIERIARRRQLLPKGRTTP